MITRLFVRHVPRAVRVRAPGGGGPARSRGACGAGCVGGCHLANLAGAKQHHRSAGDPERGGHL